jgi:hypothetical protein
MNKELLYKIPILFLIISSCKNSNPKSDFTPRVIEYPQIIDINTGFENRKELMLSEIASEVEYIKLELTKNSMIRSVTQIYIADDYAI